MWEKIKNIVNQILPIAILILVILLIVNQCHDSGRYTEQLVNLGTTINDIESAVNSVRDGLKQQESIVTELRDGQSRLESTINDITGTVQQSNGYLEQLISNESNVDGSVGAIRGTVHRLESTISTTITGIEQTGIE